MTKSILGSSNLARSSDFLRTTLCTAAALFAAVQSAAQTGAWTTAATMPTARNGSAAAAINGIVYVAGGDTASGETAALQAFNPATNTWSTLAAMPGARYQGDGAGVINGQLYVAGGWTRSPPLPNSNLYVYDPASNTWSTKASMPLLSACGATGVINGKLYVTTACNGFSGYFAFLHVYDPATNTWTAKASSPEAHANPAYGVINGKFYVAGGLTASGVTGGRLDVYDPATDTWTTKTAMRTARSGAASTVINDKLYVTGGNSGSATITSTEVYDPATDTWTTDAALPSARNLPAAATVNGQAYVIGGSDANGASSTTTSIFTPAAGTWTAGATMPLARAWPALGVVNNVIYAAGGDTASGETAVLQAYNPATNTWSTLASMPGARYQGDGAGVISGQIYVAGGWTRSPPLPNSNLYVYDPASNTWTTKASMPLLSACGATGVINGKLYVTTACNGFSGYFAFLHVYDPATNAWTAKTSSPDAHANPAYGVIGGKFYVAGGLNSTGAVSSRLDVYDPATDTWTTKTAMLTARSGAGSTVINNKLYVVGGHNGSSVISSGEVYDPTTDAWTAITALPSARSGVGAAAVNGVAYAIGGSDATGAFLNTTSVFTPAAAAAPANDAFANATVLSGASGQVSGTLVGATQESGDPTLSGLSLGTSVWYRWTAPTSGAITFTLSGYNFSAYIGAYTGSALGNLTVVSNNTVSSFVTFNATSGTTYTIMIDKWSGGGSSGTPGPFTLRWAAGSPPIFVSGGVSPSLVVVGGSVTISATFTGTAPITYQWKKNGANVSGATNSSLTLTNVQVSDSGIYIVNAANAFGLSGSAAAFLTVVAPPAFTTQPQNQTVNAGETATFSAVVTGTTPLTYQWRRNGTAIAGAASATLTLTSVQASDAATYSLFVTNSAGSATSSGATLTVNSATTAPPVITSQPSSLVVTTNGNAAFTVAATGPAPLTYQWAKNGANISGATAATLKLSNVQAADSGSYTVTVSNAGGRVTSNSSLLTVLATAPVGNSPFTVRRSRIGGSFLWGVAAGNGAVVAVGTNGLILQSADGGTWSTSDSGTADWLVGVTFGGGKFVAVGDHGRILISTDGVTWTNAASTGTVQRLNNVIYAGGKYIAVGEAGTIVVSTDAQTWTQRTSGVSTWLRGLAYCAVPKFIATGQSGVMLESTDGDTWNRVNLNGFAGDLEAAVAATATSFAAVGSDGDVMNYFSLNVAPPGRGTPVVVWQQAASSIGASARFRGLAQGVGVLFATGENGTIVSAPGTNGPWNNLNTSATTNLVSGVFDGNTLFVVGENETILQTDPLYTGRLVNISTRGFVGAGASMMFSGIVVTGTDPKQVLIRAAGPTLGAFGLSGTLAQPVLTLQDSAGKTIAANTGWTTGGNTAAISAASTKVGAFPFGATAADSALLVTLNPGLYTAQVGGVNNATGIALVEAYDADPISNGGSRAINISTRGQVNGGASNLIAGFAIGGVSSRKLLIRGIGPSLTAFGLSGVLTQPQLQLFDIRGQSQLTAGAWSSQPNVDEIRAAAVTAGAFALQENSQDAALIVTLPPGLWTVQLSGANNGTGVALIEVYDLSK